MYNKDRPELYSYYSQVREQTIDWLWYPYIPCGKITVLQGDPGDGKSTFILNIAALLTRGKPMPDGYPAKQPQTVIYQCSEDSLADTIKPRLVAAGADCSRVAYIIDDTGELNLKDHRIERTIQETNARLFILDPLQSYLVQDGDMQSAVRMRMLLGKLSIIAAKYACAIVLVSHMSKASSGKNLYRSLGSIDIAAIARSVLMISRDEESEIRYMFPVKSSLAPEGPPIGFTFDKETGFQWIHSGTPDSNIPDISRNAETQKLDLCYMTLIDLLKEGEALSVDILNHFADIGVSERTVYTAKKRLGIQSVKKNGVWYWRLDCHGNFPDCER